jgi:hypothetical protein
MSDPANGAAETEQPVPPDNNAATISGEEPEPQEAARGSRRGTGAALLSFKGNPGDVGFSHRLEIVKSVMTNPIDISRRARGRRSSKRLQLFSIQLLCFRGC